MKLPVVFCLVTAAVLAQQPATPSFEVASVKTSTEPEGHSGTHTNPGYMRLVNQTLKACITIAYNVRDFQVLGGPDWLDAQRFEIDARTSGPADDPQLRFALRGLLADRFHLAFHRENRPGTGYVLALAKGGLKIQPTDGVGGSTGDHHRNGFTAHNMTMQSLADTIAQVLRTPVSDGTGISGKFDIKLDWAPDETEKAEAPRDVRPRVEGNRPAEQPRTSLPTLAEVLQQQLGLKLEARKMDVEFLVIDHAEKPAEN